MTVLLLVGVAAAIAVPWAVRLIEGGREALGRGIIVASGALFLLAFIAALVDEYRIGGLRSVITGLLVMGASIVVLYALVSIFSYRF